MIIDTHCHFDRFSDPLGFIKDNERCGNIIIGMTNAPKHFQLGEPHVRNFKRIRLSLGFHPQAVEEIFRQLDLFKSLCVKTSYIGEIGLDFSTHFRATKQMQVHCFEQICECISSSPKIISIHSRRAEQEILDILNANAVQIPIMHWYSGPINLISKFIDYGAYFSINESMIKSANGRKIISMIPIERILTESDAPYNVHSQVRPVLDYLKVGEETIWNNLKKLLSEIPPLQASQ